ncbi:MAG: hypothetical protein Q9221_009040 [Calogaya cf. arnoldii]
MLATLIREIVATAKDAGGSAVVRYDAKKNKLVIYEGDGKKILPEDLYRKWIVPVESDKYATKSDERVDPGLEFKSMISGTERGKSKDKENTGSSKKGK